MLQESNRIELKEKLNDKLEKEICAFLNNREGGTLYIGVTDDGTVVGVEDADLLQKKVAERIRDNILPSALGLYDVTSQEIDGKTIIKVVASSGVEKPYYIKDKGSHRLVVSFAWAQRPTYEYGYDRRTLFKAAAQSDTSEYYIAKTRSLPFHSSKYIMRSAGLRLTINLPARWNCLRPRVSIIMSVICLPMKTACL